MYALAANLSIVSMDILHARFELVFIRIFVIIIIIFFFSHKALLPFFAQCIHLVFDAFCYSLMILPQFFFYHFACVIRRERELKKPEPFMHDQHFSLCIGRIAGQREKKEENNEKSCPRLCSNWYNTIDWFSKLTMKKTIYRTNDKAKQ